MPSAAYPQFEKATWNLPHVHVLAGSLVTAATPTRNTGKGFTVSNPSTGVYRITFNKRQGFIIAAFSTLHMAAGSALRMKAPIWSNSNQYVDFRIEDAAGAATAAANATDVISFIIVLTKTKLSVA